MKCIITTIFEFSLGIYPNINNLCDREKNKSDMTDKNREDLKATVFSAKDLIGYQEGAIASRMIINKPAGNITIFSFDESEGLSEHTAPYDAMVSILEGECEVTVSGATHLMKEGETIIFPANAPHAVYAMTRFKMMLVMIKG